MNRSFSLERLGLLISQHWAENRKRYLLSMVAVAGLLFMWYFLRFQLFKDAPISRSVQKITYFLFLLGVGCFFASQYFSSLGDRSKAINYLMVPASLTEKLLCAIFYVVVMYFIVFTLVFYFTVVITVGITNSFLSQSNNYGKAVVQNIFSNGNPLGGSNYFFGVFFALQSAFLLGSIYFRRYSFIKSVIGVFALCLLIYLFMGLLVQTFLPDGNFNEGITSFRVSDAVGNRHIVSLPDPARTFVSILLLFGFPPFFWLATYLRLKEKEV